MRVLTASLALLLALWLSGCAASGGPAAETRELSLAAPPEQAMQATLGLLMEQGYVIRHADLGLGRADAALARWPGYRVRLGVTPEGAGARVVLSATRGGQPLPPHLLDPLLAALQVRLGLAPGFADPPL